MNTEKKFPVSFDLCIIGSGPAGIILALEYARKNPSRQVLLVEYGSKKKGRENALDNSIKIHNSVNHHMPYDCTNKGLGGTSASWGGRCVMYDEVDFMDREINKDGCSWDAGIFQELKPYLQGACNYFECGRPAFNLREFPEVMQDRIAEGFKEGDVTDSTLERWSMPTRFGDRYAKELKALSNLTLLEGWEARTFSLPEEGGTVSSLQLREPTMKNLQEVRADRYVLAAGAQESTRILLRNTHLFNKLKKVPPALGKYYQGHLSGKIATVRFKGDPRKTDYGFKKDTDGTYLRRRFQFSSEYLQKHKLLNTAIWLDNPLYHDPKHRNGAMSLMYLAMLMPILGKRLAPPAIAHSVTKGKKQGISQHLLNILKDLPASLFIPAQIFFKRYLMKRRLPGIFLFSPQNCYALHFHAEQTPHAANRMELGGDGESLEIFYNLHDEDIQSVVKLHETLDAWLRKCGCGELEYWYPKEELPAAIRAMSKDGIHQTGTTRIAGSPEAGVVDRNLKLWGTSNVYVCSSSVFAISGQANPTFLLGAFSLRLSEYLTKNIDQKSVVSEKMLS